MALRFETKSPDSSAYNAAGQLRGSFPSSAVVFEFVQDVRDEVGLERQVRQPGGRLSRARRRIAGNVTRISEQVVSEVTRAPGNVAELVEEAAEQVGETTQEVIDVAKEIVGAEGLTLREIADALDLPAGTVFIIDGVTPWLEKVTLYANQLETLPVAQIRAASRSGDPSIINTLGLELVTPPALPGAPGFLQSPAGQLINLGVSFAGPIGTIVSASLMALTAIGGAFGRRETEQRQKQLQARLESINRAMQVQLDRSVQMLGFMGDPDALDVLGITPGLEPTIEGETKPTRFRPVIPILAAGGAAVLAITALSGPRTRPAVLGRAAVGLSGLDPSNNLGLPELTALIDVTNRLEDENDRLVGLLLEVLQIEQTPPDLANVAGFGQIEPRTVVVPVLVGLAAVAAIAAGLSAA